MKTECRNVLSSAFTAVLVAGLAGCYSVDQLKVTHVTQQKTPEGKDVVVEGTYILKSVPKAMIGLNVTTEVTQGAAVGPAFPRGHNLIVVSAGQGKFVLDLIITETGWLHVSFYPMDHGEVRDYEYRSRQSVSRISATIPSS